MCGTVIVSRDDGRSENLGGQKGQALLTEQAFVYIFPKYGACWIFGGGGQLPHSALPLLARFRGPCVSSNFEDCPFQLTIGTYKRGLQNQS